METVSLSNKRFIDPGTVGRAGGSVGVWGLEGGWEWRSTGYGARVFRFPFSPHKEPPEEDVSAHGLRERDGET